MEAINDVIVTIDKDSVVRSVNPAVEDVFGYRQDELIGTSLTKLMPDELKDQHRAGMMQYLETGERTLDWDYLELPGLRADGTEIPLAVSFSEIRYRGERYFTGVLRDISERKEYQRQLEASNERLEQFAYAASHDLQEPLRMVSSYLRLIERRYADELDEDGREFIEFAVDGADRMRDMVEGLLEYSRVETRGDPFEPVDLDDVLAEVCDDLTIKIEETHADVTVESLPTVYGDARQLRQVFQNLLSNAITYSGDDPPDIHVGAERAGDEWVLSVSDEGIGIDPEDADRVFEIFQSLHTTEEGSGTGIGLALCKRIIERHDGEIWIDSEPGEGTTFSFTLPAARESNK
ncbi:two-component sensor histidine kinase [Natrinema sp. CBA1119]|nr:two-component sensor histidine kinase [Natrinema sp. CBA1119]